MEEARSLFRNKDTTEFVIVTIPTAMAAAESGRLAKARDCAVLPAELSAALPTSGAAVPGQGLLAHPRRRVGHCASRSPAVAPHICIACARAASASPPGREEVTT